MNYEKDAKISAFLNAMLEFNFRPCITEPTRITNTNKPSLVDNVFINTLDNPFAGNILEHISYDHLPNFIVMNHENDKNKSMVRKRDKRNFNSADFQTELLDNDLILNLLNESDTNSAYNIFLSKYTKLLDKHAPFRTLSKKEKSLQRKPWLTQGLLKSISKKRSLFKKLKKCTLKNKDTTEIYHQYKTYNDTINKLKKRSKKNFYQKYFRENYKNSKKVWTGINTLLNRNRKKQSTIYLEENGLISDSAQIANKFNNYFLNVADNLRAKIPNKSNKYQDYLKNPNKSRFLLKETTPDEILKVINDLDSKKGSDIFCIPPDLVKLSNQATAQALNIIFNRSIREGLFPQAMKKAKIIPLHKGDSVLNVSNYRPISILPIFSKIYERLIYNRLIDYLETNKILSELQFGFQKNKSTEQAVTTIFSQINEARLKKKSSYCVFLDFAKAFDTVNHNILLHKLNHYGIKDKALSLFSSYLLNRTQMTEVNGKFSEEGLIRHGVPQGSVLGPLLFLLYINE